MWYGTGENRHWWTWLGWAIPGAAGLLIVGFLWVSWQIGSDVRSTCDLAMREHEGDRVTALMSYVSSSSHSLRDRNRAVWTLGNLGDARALPLLEKYRTRKPCDHERTLCQREVEKAIQLCRGGVNLPAMVWRRAYTSHK